MSAALELTTLHKQWMDHPCTKQMGRLLDKHAERIIETICVTASSSEEEANLKLRILSIQLQKSRAIKRILFDTESFVAQIQ